MSPTEGMLSASRLEKLALSVILQANEKLGYMTDVRLPAQENSN